VLASTPTSVQAWGSHHVDPIFEDVAFLKLSYDDIGVQAHIHCSWLDPRKVRLTTAVGSKKMAVYDDMNVEERIRIHDKAAMRASDGNGSNGRVSYHHGSVTSPVVALEEPLAVQARHFVECMTTGARPRTDGANGLAVVEVIEAAQLSLAEDRKVLLTEITEGAWRPRQGHGSIPVPRRATAASLHA
jgi:predicted dehydrogenase